ncbi:MAG TPA: hypothetical protein VGZ47_07450, partial [Gemmataceae bacterium]|nr:hypothetical protein [Gemmataceae bacterium]
TDPDNALAGSGTVEGAAFALLGLLIAFTFSGAAGRFDSRRQQIVEEANDIGTAYLRIDLLPAETQPALRDLFRKYLDSRIETYRHHSDREAAAMESARSQKLQSEIWAQAVAACQAKRDPATTTLVLGALNAMFDITTTRSMSAKMHPPPIVFVLLIGLALVCAALAGIGMAGSKSRSWLHIVAFAAITAVTVYVILDIEHPRLGLFRLDATDQVLVDLRANMK